MGLGKTATTLAHLVELPGPHLVVCPLSVVRNWSQESARFTPKLDVRVHHGSQRAQGLHADDTLFDSDPERQLIITTYGLLPRDLEHLGNVDWSTVVLDEAQMVKNPNTKAARAVRQLRAGQKLALTGTPVENRLSELWSILDAVNPGLLGGQQKFREQFGTPIERHGDAEAAARLRRITQPFILRRTKADKRLLPDLPDKIEQIAYAKLTREQATLYQQVVDQLLADAELGQGHAPSRTGARRADAAEADLQPSGPRARRRLATRRAIRQADPVRRTRHRPPRPGRTGARVHAVPGDGRTPARPT